MHARVGGSQRAVGRLGRHHVEGRHRLRKMHRVVEPEALVVALAELGVIRVRRLRPFGSRHDLQRAGQRKFFGQGRWWVHSERVLQAPRATYWMVTQRVAGRRKTRGALLEHTNCAGLRGGQRSTL